MKVYTKVGDKGTTSLIGGERVSKYDIRVEAYGTVDELSAHIALLSDKMSLNEDLMKSAFELIRINSMLMNIEAHLAVGNSEEPSGYQPPEISGIEQLEESIDRMQALLPSIDKFTIPGGCELNSLSHIARTVCRRAERRAVEVEERFGLDPQVLIYLNRLSDYLYLLGRYASFKCDCHEQLWIP